jgi:hypothetical protein
MKRRFSSFQLILAFSFLSLLSIVSCKKETSGTNDNEEVTASQTSSESDAQSEIIFNEVFDNAMGVSDEVGMFGTGVFARINSCPTVTVLHLTANQFPIRVTLDFGATGCVGNDGHQRRGKIITEYTGRLVYPGSIATTTFDGFYFDSIHVEGTHRISNISVVSTVPIIRKFEAKVENGKLTFQNGNYVNWNSTKIITQIEGAVTPDPHDDQFKVEGSANGTALRGNLLVAWQSTITEPLLKKFNCRWIVKGRVRTVRANTNVNSQWVGVLDFGTGNCDNQATVTINGVTHQITLP